MTNDELLKAGKRLMTLAPNLERKQLESLLSVVTGDSIADVNEALAPLFAKPIEIGASVKLSQLPHVKGVVVGKFVDVGKDGLVVKWNSGYIANHAEFWLLCDPEIETSQSPKSVTPSDILRLLK